VNFNYLLKTAKAMSMTDMLLAAFLVACAVVGLCILLYVGIFAARERLQVRRERRMRRKAREARRQAGSAVLHH
jgi:uncharacterized protein (DUF2062 family)